MDEFYCRCGHSIDVHMNDCMVGTCACRRSVEEVTDYNVARMSRGMDPLTSAAQVNEAWDGDTMTNQEGEQR